MTLTRYGTREWGGGGIIALLIIFAGVAIGMECQSAIGWSIAVAAGFAWLCLAAFFRSPQRKIPADDSSIVSPADGVVTDIRILDGEEWGFLEGSEILRIGIFLSVLDVHLNRAPTDMTVKAKRYKPGKYLDARHSDATRENESMLIVGEAEFGKMRFPIGVRQISGAIARRIVCRAEPGTELRKGRPYGMIKFGSRTELYLTRNEYLTIMVKVGEKVYAGTSVMAKIEKQGAVSCRS